MIKSGLLLITCALVTLSGPLLADEPDFPRMKPGDRGDDARAKMWESLTPEQRDKLREALRDVWIDPAVINAREEVKQATDAYQAAIKAAVSRADPSIAGVMAKIQEANSGAVNDRIAGRPSMGPGGKPGFEGQIRPPGFLESISPEMREKIKKAEDAAIATGIVTAAKDELDSIREEDDALRRKRIEAHRKLRKVTVDEMVRIDPSLSEVQARLLGGERGGSLPPGVRKNGEPRREDGEKREKKKEGPDATERKPDPKPETPE
jgi:hypothetical protein